MYNDGYFKGGTNPTREDSKNLKYGFDFTKKIFNSNTDVEMYNKGERAARHNACVYNNM